MSTAVLRYVILSTQTQIYVRLRGCSATHNSVKNEPNWRDGSTWSGFHLPGYTDYKWTTTMWTRKWCPETQRMVWWIKMAKWCIFLKGLINGHICIWPSSQMTVYGVAGYRDAHLPQVGQDDENHPVNHQVILALTQHVLSSNRKHTNRTANMLFIKQYWYSIHKYSLGPKINTLSNLHQFYGDWYSIGCFHVELYG